jgi:hypothetical protein
MTFTKNIPKLLTTFSLKFSTVLTQSDLKYGKEYFLASCIHHKKVKKSIFKERKKLVENLNF